MARSSPLGPTVSRWVVPRSLLFTGLAALGAQLGPLQVQAQDTRPATEAADSDEPASPSSPEVRAILTEAVAEHEAGRYSEALALFRRAHELAPTARTLRGIGMAAYELRQYVTALRAFRESLTNSERALTDVQRAQAEDLLTRARGFVVTVRVEVDPPDATLRIDGVLAQREDDGSLMLEPGAHTLALRHDDRLPRTLEVHLEPGASQVLRIELEPREVIDASIPPPPPSPRGGASDALVWSGVALGIAASLGVVVSVATGAIAVADRAQLRSECSVYVCPDSSRATRDRARDLALTTDVVGGIAAALGASGVLLLVLGVAGAAPGFDAAALCTGDGCVGSISGTF